jgi:hypothetical protein
MYIETCEQVFYTNKKPIPLDDVIASLDGYSHLFKMIPSVLTGIDESLLIDDITVYVDEIKTGSLLEIFLVGLAFGKQESFEQQLALTNDWLHNSLNSAGISNEQIRKIIIFLIVLIILQSADMTLDYIKNTFGGRNEASQIIQTHNNYYLNVSAEQLHTFTDAIKNAINRSIDIFGKKKVSKEVRKVIAPAKLETDSEIHFSNKINNKEEASVRFDKTLINALPSYDT